MGKLALIGLLLLSACAFYNGPVTLMEPHAAVGSTQQVQSKLQQQGLYHGEIDGVAGPLTHAAVQSYQQTQHITATGRLNTETMNSLNLP